MILKFYNNIKENAIVNRLRQNTASRRATDIDTAKSIALNFARLTLNNTQSSKTAIQCATTLLCEMIRMDAGEVEELPPAIGFEVDAEEEEPE